MQLKIEQEALKKETDQASRDRLARLEGELDNLQEQSDALTVRWRAEKDKLGSAQKLKEQLEAARNDLAQAQRRGEYQRAGELTYGVIPDLEKKLAEVEAAGRDRLVDEAVTPDRIAQVVSRWTGVPVDKMLAGREGQAAEHGAGAGATCRRAGRGGQVPSRPPCAAPAPGCRTRTGRSARSCSSGRRGSARPN